MEVYKTVICIDLWFDVFSLWSNEISHDITDQHDIFGVSENHASNRSLWQLEEGMLVNHWAFRHAQYLQTSPNYVWQKWNYDELLMVQLRLLCWFTTAWKSSWETNMNLFGSIWIPSSVWQQSCWSHGFFNSNLILWSLECVKLFTVFSLPTPLLRKAYADLTRRSLRKFYFLHKPSKAWNLPHEIPSQIPRKTYGIYAKTCTKQSAVHMCNQSF